MKSELSAAEGFMIKSVLVAGLFLSAPLTRSWAGQPSPPAVLTALNATSHDGDGWKTDALRALDLEIDGTASEIRRSVAVTIDGGAMLAKLPLLQKHGALSESITDEEVARQPASYTNALSLLLTSYAVRNLYGAHPELGRTHWKVSLKGPADAGGQEAREIYSFAFDQSLYESTVWDQLPFTEFPRTAETFSYNLRFTLDMSREVSGSIDDD